MFSDKDRDLIDTFCPPEFASCSSRMRSSQRFIRSRSRICYFFRSLTALFLSMTLVLLVYASALPSLAKSDEENQGAEARVSPKVQASPDSIPDNSDMQKSQSNAQSPEKQNIPTGAGNQETPNSPSRASDQDAQNTPGRSSDQDKQKGLNIEGERDNHKTQIRQENKDSRKSQTGPTDRDGQKTHSEQESQKAQSERHTMQLYFATTRFNEGSDMSPNYKGERHLDNGNGTLEFGTAGLVEPAELRSPSTASDGKQYKRLMRQNADQWRASKFTFVSKTDEEDFFKHIHEWTGTICIYIHGYDKPFIEAAEDACLVFKDYQQYENTPQKKLLRVLFSWPSIGGRTEYGTDEANIEWSAPAFDTFMDRVLAEKNPQAKLDIIGHSMGVRLIMGYLSKNCTIKDKPIFEDVFLCSGDIDFLLMEGEKKLLDQAVADKAFIFVSDRDKAMILSHFVHEKPRLGRPIDPPKFTMAQRNQVFSSVYVSQIFTDTSDLLGGNDYTESPDVKKWLADDPKLDQDFSAKARLIDVSQLVTKDFGHGVAFSVVAAYMAGKGTPPLLKEDIVHKRPDRTSLKQNGGKPSHLYRFLRLEPINTD